MAQSTAVTDIITTLSEAEQRFSLRRTEDEQFFLEWQTALPDLSEADRIDLDVLRRRYLCHRSDGHLLEGAMTLLLASPLLTIAGFYDPPFKMKAETAVQISLNDEEEVLQGRLDVLVLQERIWVLVLASKKTTISALSALPQTLAYLMANPNPGEPEFAIITNGDEILLVKLVHNSPTQYALSRVFAPFTLASELYQVAQILRRIGQIVA